MLVPLPLCGLFPSVPCLCGPLGYRECIKINHSAYAMKANSLSLYMTGTLPGSPRCPGFFISRGWGCVTFNKMGHLFIGTAISVFVCHSFTELLIVLFGSLWPDVDKKNSTLGRFNLFNRVGLFTHRGHCHSLLGVAVISAPFLFIGWRAYTLCLIGCIGHLAGDKLLSWMPGHQKFRLKLW